MRRYVTMSGVFFILLAGVQLLRLALQWPVNVAGKDIPLWPSGLAALIVGTFAIWSFRVRSRDAV